MKAIEMRESSADLAIPTVSAWACFAPHGRISPYGGSSLRVPPGLVVFRWSGKAGLDEDAMRRLLRTTLDGVHSPLPAFTRDEVVQIVFLERDKNTDALARLYEAAEVRYQAAYANAPTLNAGRAARELP